MKITQNCEKYKWMYRMFGLQAIYDNMNQLNCHLSTSGTCWTQELPVNHTEWHKINKLTHREIT